MTMSVAKNSNWYSAFNYVYTYAALIMNETSIKLLHLTEEAELFIQCFACGHTYNTLCTLIR